MSEEIIPVSSNVAEVSLFSLDVLPPKCAIESQIKMSPERPGWLAARFRVSRRVGPAWRRKREYSDWSGWFVYEGEPIALRWETFW